MAEVFDAGVREPRVVVEGEVEGADVLEVGGGKGFGEYLEAGEGVEGEGVGCVEERVGFGVAEMGGLGVSLIDASR